MKVKIQTRTTQKNRKSECGAALVTSLLVVTALLVVGGALVQVTSMSARNAIDSTAEAQAYYGAESGIQAALNAIRGNTPPSGTTKPAGYTKIGTNFRYAVDLAYSNDRPGGTGGDPSTVARLSRYLNYTNRQVAGTRVVVGTNPTVEYDVEVSVVPGDVLPAAPAQPKRLLIRSTGYGPNGAIKRMQTIVSRSSFDATAPAMMTLIGTPSGSPPMNFDAGNSTNHLYSGTDVAGVVNGMPAFGVTNTTDLGIATADAGPYTDSVPVAAVLSGSSVPDYLRSPGNARDFLYKMQALAIEGQANGNATYLPNGGRGTPTGFTFVKGDYVMDTGTGGGLLIVTGDLTTNGNTTFDGMVLVIGRGSVNRNGGGGGHINGAMFIAQVDWPAASPAQTSFGAPYFNFNGGGTSDMKYDSSAIANALSLAGRPVLGVSEN